MSAKKNFYHFLALLTETAYLCGQNYEKLIIMSYTNDYTDASQATSWPEEPSFLLNREWDAENNSYSPDSDGFFSANELRGILADASAKMWEEEGVEEDEIGRGQLYALFQVIPKEFKFPVKPEKKWIDNFSVTETEHQYLKDILRENREIIRIHPGNLYPNLRCCVIFRGLGNDDESDKSCKYGQKCCEIDSRILLLYHPDLPIVEKDENGDYIWDHFYEKYQAIIDDYNKKIIEMHKTKYKDHVEDISTYLLEIEPKKHEHGDKINKRPYVSYRCIYSGLVECFFPIFYAGKVIAVLMRGQSPTYQLKADEMFKKYRLFNQSLDDSIKQIVKDDKEANVAKVNKRIFNLPADYDPIKDRLVDISNLIEGIESRIDKAFTARTKKYISDNFFKIEMRFREEVKNQMGITIPNISDGKSGNLLIEIKKLSENLKTYRKILDTTLKNIINHFDSDGFIRIYAIESPFANTINTKKDGFNLIGDSDFDKNNDSLYSKIIFNKINERSGELAKEVLLKENGANEAYFPERYWEKAYGFDKDMDIFCIDFSFSPQIAYLIWERYTKSDLKTGQQIDYKWYLKLMYHTLLEPYIIIERLKLEKDLENTIRISSHESAQITPYVLESINISESLKSIDNVTELYKGPEYITKDAKEIIDASRRLLLLNAIFKRLSYVFKDEAPNPEFVDFYRIIYATESLFQDKVYLSKYQKIHVDLDGDLKKYSLKTGYEELSHILFNLIDNATKYGLCGSKIWIKALLHKGATKIIDNYRVIQLYSKITISVVSYGDAIEENDREKIFELYYRSKNARGIEGMGIGGFLAKKLSNLLGYEITCMESNEMANYNIPLKYHYCKQNIGFDYYTSYYNSDTFDILRRNLRPELVYEIVNTNVSKDDWELTIDDLQLLPTPTYRNEFKITIPIEDNNCLKRIKYY